MDIDFLRPQVSFCLEAAQTSCSNWHASETLTGLIPDPKQQDAWLECTMAPPRAKLHYHFKQVQRYSDNLTAHVMTCFNYPRKEPPAPAQHLL